MLERGVVCEERGERADSVQPEGVVGEVDGVQVWQLEQRLQEEVEGWGDLREAAGGEDVGEVGDLCRGNMCQSSLLLGK